MTATLRPSDQASGSAQIPATDRQTASAGAAASSEAPPKTTGSSQATVPPKAVGTGLIMTGVILTAANLRLSVSATGDLLNQLDARLHLGNAVTAFLPSVWVIAFSLGGFSGSALARRFGADRVVGAALAALIAGTVLRGVASTPALLVGSVVAGLGIALGNVLLPVVCRQYFPGRMGMVTGLYGTALSAGSAISALLSVQAANALGSPSRGLAIWAVPGVVALLAWLAAHRQRTRHTLAAHAAHAAVHPTTASGPAHIPLSALTRSRLAWAMAALFGLQSAAAYVLMGYLPSVFEAAGMSADRAGALLSATFFIGLPASFAAPVLAARMPDPRLLLGGLSLLMTVGFLGLALDPVHLAWAWIVVLAVGMSTFQLVLALFGIRGGTPAATAALSTFGQSIGYLAAAVGPFGAGLLHHATGSWTLPLVVMAGVGVLQCLAGLYVGSPRRGTLASSENPFVRRRADGTSAAPGHQLTDPGEGR